MWKQGQNPRFKGKWWVLICVRSGGNETGNQLVTDEYSGWPLYPPSGNLGILLGTDRVDKDHYAKAFPRTPLGDLTTLPKFSSRLRRGNPHHSPLHSTPAASSSRRSRRLRTSTSASSQHVLCAPFAPIPTGELSLTHSLENSPQTPFTACFWNSGYGPEGGGLPQSPSWNAAPLSVWPLAPWRQDIQLGTLPYDLPSLL